MCLPTPPSWFSDNNKFKNKKEPDYQKIELYGSPTTKELKKKHSSRPVVGQRRTVRWRGHQQSGDWWSEWSHICVQINQEELLEIETDRTIQGSNMGK